MTAYNKIYLEDATHNFGVMIDCAVNTLGCPAKQFWARFLASSISDRFSCGAVDIIAGHSGVELALMVMAETGRRIEGCDASISISSREYWAGTTLAHYQWSSGFSYQELSSRGLGLEETIAMFNPLHEADQSVFEHTADEITREKASGNSWLKEARQANGMTQKELSERSCAPIRLIRAYEQGKISIDNAEYRTVTKLKRALHMYFSQMN